MGKHVWVRALRLVPDELARMAAVTAARRAARRALALRNARPLSTEWELEPAWQPWTVAVTVETRPTGRAPLAATADRRLSTTSYPLT